MSMAIGARNARGFSDCVQHKRLPPPSHLSFEGLFNEIEFNVGPKTSQLVDVHVGYAKYQFEKSNVDDRVHDYLGIFLKSRKDGSDRDQTVLNATICLDVSGSMAGNLSAGNQSHQSRLAISIEAIKMFYSKLRPEDSLGLVIFNHKAYTLMEQTTKKQIAEEELFAILNQLKPSGTTSLQMGFEMAAELLGAYNEKVETKCPSENRIIMVTDVCDNSVEGVRAFIEEASKSTMFVTIIGISSEFQSGTCERMKDIKGFNYFSAIDDEDLMKHIFHNFDFVYFPIAHHVSLRLKTDNVKSIEVFGSGSDEQVHSVHGQYVLANVPTIFPSEISIKEEVVHTYGGLILIKMQMVEQSSQFDGELTVAYVDVEGKEEQRVHPLHFPCPLNEQYTSEECLSQALQAYFFVSEVKHILSLAEKGEKEGLAKYLPTLKYLIEVCPQSKKKDLQHMMSMIEQ